MALNNKGTIKFNYHEVSFRLQESLLYKSFLASVMAQEQTMFSRIEYIFCTDAFLINLNRQYLNHDTYTDIITFTLSLPSDPVISEIYISTDRVLDNSEKLKIPFEEELLRVMIHGLLHLCGYDDSTPTEKKKMRAKENHYIAQFKK